MASTASQVSNLSVSLRGQAAVDGATFTGCTANNAASNAACLKVMNIDTGSLQVAPIGYSSAVTNTPAVNMSLVYDTLPPVITLLSSVYVEVLQGDQYTEPGAAAADNIDGNSVPVHSKTQLCNRHDSMRSVSPRDQAALVCSNNTVAALDISLPTTSSTADQVYVITYSARDAAGNQAAAVRRYVEVLPRWAVRLRLKHSDANVTAKARNCSTCGRS